MPMPAWFLRPCSRYCWVNKLSFYIITLITCSHNITHNRPRTTHTGNRLRLRHLRPFHAHAVHHRTRAIALRTMTRTNHRTAPQRFRLRWDFNFCVQSGRTVDEDDHLLIIVFILCSTSFSLLHLSKKAEDTRREDDDDGADLRKSMIWFVLSSRLVVVVASWSL